MSDVVVVVDSDVQLIGDELDALLDALGAPGVEAAWMPAVETSRETLGDRASAAVLDTSLHAFTLLSRLDGGGFVGKVMAVRHDALERVGGFGSLVRYLGEDVELGRRLRASGGATRVASGRAEARTSGRLVRDVIGRYARWIQVVRAQRPWLLATYPAIVAATPLLVAATLGTLAFDPGSAAAALALALGSRALVAIVARRRGARREGLVRLPADALMADVLLLAAFVRALVGGPVSWRGRRLRWGDGELDQEASSVGGPCG
jgi:ceramide glucosyltransferase